MDVSIDFAAAREDDRSLCLTAVLEDVVRHHHVLERAMRLAHELLDLRLSSELNYHTAPRLVNAADARGIRRIVAAQVLEQILEVVGPRVRPLVDSEHFVAVSCEPQCQVGSNLTARSGDDYAHARQCMGADG